MNFSHISCALLLALSPLAQAQAPAQSHEHHNHGTAPAAAAAAETTPFVQGEVRKIDRETRKITLRHAEIPNLQMQSMTMVFQVADPALLDAAAVGDTVRFRAERRTGAIVVTALEKAAP